MSDTDKDTGSDAAKNPLDLSALTPRDLMAGWVSDLESPQKFSKDRYRDERGDDDRGGKGRGGGRGGGFGGGGGRGRDNRGGGGGGGGRGRDDRGGGGGGGRGNFKGGGQGRGQDRGGRGGGGDRRFQGPPPDPAPQFALAVEPSQETVEALAKHFRATGRAYSMFDVARNVMAERGRYQVAFQGKLPPAKKKNAARGDEAEGATEASGAEAAPEKKPETAKLVRCKIDGSLWLTRDEAVRHVLSTPELMGEFYIVEEVSVDPPKGNFSSIAICGMSGTLLGPPNHHEYQTKLAKLHREQFSNMPFERFKQRVQMKNDEETIEAWKQSVSVATHYRIKPKEVKKKEEEPTADAATAGEGATEATAEASVENSDVPAAESADSAAQPEPNAEPEAVAEAATETVADGGDEAAVDDTAEVETPASEEASVAEDEQPAEADGAESEGESPDTEGDAESSENPESDAEPGAAEAEEAEPEIVLANDRELEMHFRENFADKVLRWAGGGVVRGDVPGRNLSPALLEKLKFETERMRRGFPLPLIQTLCRRLEKLGVKFFKRDKKELYASVARPKAIRDETGMSDRLRGIVEFVRAYPKTKVPKLLETQIEGFIAPRNEEEMAGHKTSEEEMSMLRDIRWLTMEGYLIEYANGDLVLGHDEPSHKGGHSGGGDKGKRGQRQGEKKAAASTEASATSPADTAAAVPPADAEKKSEPEPAVEPKAESSDTPPQPSAPEGEAGDGSKMPTPEVADASPADSPPEPKAEPEQEV